MEITDLKTSKEDMVYIKKIVDRSMKEFGIRDGLSLMMDLESIHAETPLRLKEFSECEGFDFQHDIFGIYECFDRESKTLKKCFLPRFAKHERKAL